ncbi:MAG: 4'-phosphopantetheinyl transferase superfamily protein [Bacteroidales bacterium]|nr:4'-phosphopantetheinyl transferase superfamily protein [Bacteroidales bacterium]
MIIYYFKDFESVDDGVIERLLQCFPQQQIDLVRGMKTMPRRREQAVGYFMTAYALQHDAGAIHSERQEIQLFHPSYFDCPLSSSAAPLWRYGSHGKPYLTNYEELYFNISHCRQAIVTAVSGREVGVDVEGSRKFSDGLLQRAYNEEEQAMVKSSDEPEKEFARLWTRKEAYFKWTGTGILISHLPDVTEEAAKAGCRIDTRMVDDSFWLSVAQGVD